MKGVVVGTNVFATTKNASSVPPTKKMTTPSSWPPKYKRYSSAANAKIQSFGRVTNGHGNTGHDDEA
jgi:hypothetical protein